MLRRKLALNSIALKPYVRRSSSRMCKRVSRIFRVRSRKKMYFLCKLLACSHADKESLNFRLFHKFKNIDCVKQLIFLKFYCFT